MVVRHLRIPDEELWAARQRLRGYLVDFTRERARRRWTREQPGGARARRPGNAARSRRADDRFCRADFADDLRPDIIFHDARRLAAILTARRRPVQIIVRRARPCRR